MTMKDSANGAGEAGRRRITRRGALLAGGVSAAALAGAAAIAAANLPARSFTVDAMLAQKPFFVAHRGSENDWPEQSLYAYQQCVARGLRVLEFSVSRTIDGVWFGLHDGTLDRLSGTTGFLAAEHTWKEVQQHRISAKATTSPGQPDRPYLDLHGFLDRFGSSNVLFIDPKAVDPHHYPQLLATIEGRVPTARQTVIAKSEASNVTWPRLAKTSGIRSWGFYYGKDLPPTSDIFSTTLADWDLIGLNQEATAEQWKLVTSTGKPVIGHVISTQAGRDRVVGLGARGVMCSDVVAAGA
ncbi:glycerophosphodiester phosphodiesterase [Amnibacterium sp.]|uniref:glycerophosphodiester phosphodiesterase n=1 Tax=Amnibacterium sp. TaxID=1872496 RepID=UPI003F7CC03F